MTTSPYGGEANRRGPDDMDAYADTLLKQAQHYAPDKKHIVLTDLYVALEQIARECAYLRRRVAELEKGRVVRNRRNRNEQEGHR